MKIIIFILLMAEASQRRFYEAGEYPHHFCPKTNTCPNEEYMRRSSYFNYKICDSINDCNLGLLCCVNACTNEKYCSLPVQYIDDHEGQCPVSSSSCSSRQIYGKARCRKDSDCFLDSKCCVDTCLKSSVCQQLENYRQEFRSKEDEVNVGFANVGKRRNGTTEPNGTVVEPNNSNLPKKRRNKKKKRRNRKRKKNSCMNGSNDNFNFGFGNAYICFVVLYMKQLILN